MLICNANLAGRGNTRSLNDNGLLVFTHNTTHTHTYKFIIIGIVDQGKTNKQKEKATRV